MAPFWPRPPPPSYKITSENDDTSENDEKESLQIHLLDKDQRELWIDDYLPYFQPYIAPSASGSQIACVHLKLFVNPAFTILHFHQRAGDIGSHLGRYVHLALQLECNLMALDYSGYGGSSGKATEANLYLDAMAARDLLTKTLHVLPHEILLYGDALGAAVGIDLATRVNVAGLIVVSSSLSANRTLMPGRLTMAGEMFKSSEKIGKVKTSTLIVSGLQDIHATGLSQKCPGAVDLLCIEEAGHEDIYTDEAFWIGLKHFINQVVNGAAKENRKRRQST